ncbi:diaminopimelate decarboxylase [alpha proteobacterium Q-1]|nr:diaminopimelate decarboxylase [alpha proteobacterium Q-1]
MDHFQYKKGGLHAEDVPLARIAAEVGTPVYVYSTATLCRHYQIFDEALSGTDHLTCFAVKANSNLSVLASLARLGCGADVVSGGELARALAAGIPARRIVFSGVGKLPQEMDAALDAGIHQFNVESEPELEALSALASAKGMKAPVSLRINPDIDAKTHAKISTGRAENKFGIAWSRAHEAYAHAQSLPGIAIVGIDVHIGSQLTELGPFRAAFDRVAELVASLRAAGHGIERIDLGGGLGIPYQPDQPAPPLPSAYGAMVKEVASDLGCQIITEPGRLIAGNAGVLLTQVIYVKDGEDRRFVILDAAMNDLLRPAMYDAYHGIAPLIEPGPDAGRMTADFVGPVCETGDRFAKDRQTTTLAAGDLVVLRSAGAYGAVMASSYNTRPLVPEVLVHGADYAIIRPRIDVAALLAQDQLAPWLA